MIGVTLRRTRPPAVRRILHAPGPASVTAALITMVGTLVGLVAGAAPAALDGSVGAALASAAPSARVVEVSVRRDPAAAAKQDAAVPHELGRALAGAGATVWASRRGELLPVVDLVPVGTAQPRSPRAGQRVVPWAAADLPDHARLTAGRWPVAGEPGTAAGGMLEAALQADAAAAIGVRPGDRMVLGPTDPTSPRPPQVTVVGLWRAGDAADPYWLGSALETTGRERPGVLGPLVVDAGALAAVPVRWTSRWRAGPDPARLTAAGLPALAAGIAALPDRLADLPAGGGAVPAVDGGLGAEVDRLQASVRAARAGQLAVLAILVALSATGCLSAAAVQGAARAGEAVTLRARGASRWQQASAVLLELVALAAGCAVPAAAAGVGRAAVLLRGLHLAPMDVVRRVGLAAAVAVLGAGLLIGALTSLLVTRAAGATASMDDRGGRRAHGSCAGPIWIVLLAIGALAGWQLWRAGWTGAQLAGGAVDPLVVVAVPVLLLAAGALTVVAVRLPAAPLALLGRGRRALPALVGWQLTRRVGAPGGPLTVLAAAAAAAVCAAGTAGTLAERTAAGVREALGAPVVVSAPIPGGDPADSGALARLGLGAALAAVPEVGAVSAALPLPGRIAGGDVTVLATDAGSLAEVTADAGRAHVPPDAATRLAGHRHPVVALGSGSGTGPASGRLSVELTVTDQPPSAADLAGLPPELVQALGPGGGASIQVTVLVTGADGVAVRLPLGALAVPAGTVTGATTRHGTLAALLPDGARGLAGMELSGGPAALHRTTVTVAVRDGAGRLLTPASGWAVRAAAPGSAAATEPSATSSPDQTLHVVPGGPAGTVTLRITPSFEAQPVVALIGPSWDADQPVPALIDRQLATAIGAGDRPLALELADGSMQVRVVGVLEETPGSTDPAGLAAGTGAGRGRVLLDLATLTALQLADGRTPPAPTQWWLAGAAGSADRGGAGATSPAALPEVLQAVVRDRVAGLGTSSVTVTAEQVTAAALDQPVLRAMIRLTWLLVPCAGLLAVTVLLLGDVVGARRRRGELAVLRALGAAPGQVRRLVLAEQLGAAGIVALAGVAVGIVLGRLAVPVLAGPQLISVGGFTAWRVATGPPSVPWPAVGVVSAVALAAVVASALLRGRWAGRIELAAALREQAR
jgi:hypothetical protein